MDWLNAAFDHIHEAATSPLAFVAYGLAVLGGVLLSSQIIRNNSRLKLITALPERDRDARAREIIGRPIPETISAELWLKHQTQLLFLAAFAVACVTAIIIVAISVYYYIAVHGEVAMSSDKRSTTGPTTLNASEPVAPAPVSPALTDVDLVGQLQLREDRTAVLAKFGPPLWSDKAEGYRPRADVFRKPDYDLTVGYDANDHVSIFSVVPNNLHAKPEWSWCGGFRESFADLKLPAFLSTDSSSKFFYYAEGARGDTEAEGHTTTGCFYTDLGVDEPSTNATAPPSDELVNLKEGDDPPSTRTFTSWRRWVKPNGFVTANSETELSDFFFKDYDWVTSVPAKN